MININKCNIFLTITASLGAFNRGAGSLGTASRCDASRGAVCRSAASFGAACCCCCIGAIFALLFLKDRKQIIIADNPTRQSFYRSAIPHPEVEFLNSKELSLIKSSPLPAQLPWPGRS